MKIKLKKAILHRGEEVKELDIPLEDLTGNDLIEVEDQIIKTGNPMQTLDFSRVYLITLAARAAHMPVETLRQMNSRDFAKIVTEVRNFLAGSDLEEDGTEENEEKVPEISSVA